MFSLEETALKLGTEIVKAALKAVMARQDGERIQGSSLSDIARGRLSRLDLRSAERRAEDFADKIARRLEPLYRNEFRQLSEQDRDAILLEVGTLFERSDLSDVDLFAADLSPLELWKKLRPTNEQLVRTGGLGEPGIQYYDRALTEACQCFLQVVLTLQPFLPRAAVEILVRQSRLEDQFEEILNRLPRPIIEGTRKHANDEFLDLYRRNVVQAFDRLELFGIDSRYRPPLKLSIGYVDLTIERESGEDVDQAHPRVDGQSHLVNAGQKLNVEQALGSGRRFLVRGHAGSGKSTLLRWLAVTAATQDFTGELQSWNDYVPFLIKLRTHANSDLPELSRFIDPAARTVRDRIPNRWVYNILRAGRGMLLVDGVDELPESRRVHVYRWLEQLLGNYPQTRVVVTSRPDAAERMWLRAMDFSPFLIEPMTPSESRVFVRRWHEAVAKSPSADYFEIAELPAFESHLIRQLELAPHLRSLASSPLMCAMVCALHLEREGQLPASRNDLYDAALDLLLERRDKIRDIDVSAIPLDKAAKLTALRSLAWWLTKNAASELPRDDALARIAQTLRSMTEYGVDPDKVLQHLVSRSGIIREPVVGRIDFIHRTFQEFLSAKDVVEQNDIQMLINHADQDQWREVVFMTPGHATQAQRIALVSGLLSKAESADKHRDRLLLMASVCAASSVTLPRDLRDRAETALDHLIPPKDREAAETLASVGERVLPLLPQTVSSLDEGSAAACVRTAALIAGTEAATLLAKYRDDARPVVQREIIASWEYFDLDAYSSSVLADAPLDNGHIRLDHTRPLQFCNRLRQLRSVTLESNLLRLHGSLNWFRICVT